MAGIEIVVPCRVTVLIESEDESLSSADLGQWVDENHADVRRAVETAVQFYREELIGWSDENNRVFVLDTLLVDALPVRTLGATAFEYREADA